MTNQLEDAYRQTSYTFFCATTKVVIRLDRTSDSFERFMATKEQISWAYISAYNPNSIPHSSQFNQQHHEKLRYLLQAEGFKFFEGYGEGDDGCWPKEYSFFVLGISETKANDIGARFGQQAILIGTGSKNPQLLWL